MNREVGELKERFDEKYFKFTVSLITAGVAIIVFYFALRELPELRDLWLTLVGILSPFLYGLIMAYLLTPIFNLVTRKTYFNLKPKMENRKAFLIAKFVASVVSMAFLIAVVSGIIAMLIPQVVSSVMTLIQTTPGRLQDLNDWLSTTIVSTNNPQLIDSLENIINNAYDYLLQFAEEKILPGVDGYVQKISQGLIITVKTFLNILIGLIVCVYFLNGKERFKAQATKAIYAIFRRDKAESIFEFGNFANRTFGGFINGKIIDSIIIGFICYFVMLIMHLPYAALCSTIVGITNIIPFFGPFIGAVPSAIIICVVSPIKALEFLIMILVLQQFDGNILGPRILGNTTGLGSFWVMLAIIFFGGYFGFVGMILGVPICAIVYHYSKRYLEKRLRRKGLDEKTEDYMEFNKYNINRKDIL